MFKEKFKRLEPFKIEELKKLGFVKKKLDANIHTKVKEYNPTNTNNIEKIKDIEDLITTEDVCKILRLDRHTLSQYNSERRIPFYKIGHKNLYNKKDVLEYVSRHRISSSSELDEKAINYD